MTEQAMSPDQVHPHEPVDAAGLWSERRPIATQVQCVTFFEDRAQVQRQAQFDVNPGLQVVMLTGVTVFVDDVSVAVKVIGPDGQVDKDVEVVSTHVVRKRRDASELSHKQVEELEREFDRASARVTEVSQQIERRLGHRQRVEALMESWRDSLETLPASEQSEPAPWIEAHRTLQTALLQDLDAMTVLAKERHRAAGNRDAIRRTLTDATVQTPRYYAAVEVQLSSSCGKSVAIELTYRCACALWRPEHVAVLQTAEDGSNELSVETFATVWQMTGERWEDIASKFSTARPAKHASPPLLQNDVLSMRKKTPRQRQEVVVQLREQEVATVGQGASSQAVEQMPGVDDGGEIVAYDATVPWTIPSDGKPVRIPLQKRVLPCTVEPVAYPEVSEAVHVKASAVWPSAPGEDATPARPAMPVMPLLAGPLWIGRHDAIMGRSQIPFVAKGERFDIGMGIDDGLHVRRTVHCQRDTSMLGKQKRTYRVELFVSNLADTKRKVTLVERYPLSEIEDVEVQVLRSEGGRVNPKDGMVKYELELAPCATETRLLEYRVVAGANVVLGD